MRHVALAVVGRQRHRDAVGADRRIAINGGTKHIVQCLLRFRLVGGKPSGGRTQQGALDQERAAIGIGIGMNDPRARIDQDQAGP
jgi:hypothetical protein